MPKATTEWELMRLSSLVELYSVTQQECLWYSLLFALAMEYFAQKKVDNLFVTGRCHKIVHETVVFLIKPNTFVTL